MDINEKKVKKNEITNQSEKTVGAEDNWKMISTKIIDLLISTKKGFIKLILM